MNLTRSWRGSSSGGEATVRRPHAARRLGAAVAVLVIGAGFAAMAASGGARQLAHVRAGRAKWNVYHANAGGSGALKGSIALSHVHQVWQSPVLTGQLYGEPLVSGSYVYVATTADVVYALNVADGTIAWSKTVGTHVPATSLPCGDISPT